MPKRREKGEGSVYQRKSDGMYVAYCRLENGRKKYLYDKTRAGVVKKLKELQTAIKQGQYVKAMGETVETYLRSWLEQQSQLKETSYACYRAHIKYTLAIGSIKLQKLTPDKVQAMYTDLSKNKHLGPATIKLIHRILYKAFKDAIRLKLLAPGMNPCQDLLLPKNERSKSQSLNAEQAKKLLTAAGTTDLAAFVSLALGLGLRRGEVLGLRWADVNLEGRYLEVKHTLSSVPDGNGHTYFSDTDPKSHTSQRKIVFPQFVIDALKAHKVKQLEVRLAAEKWEDKDLVFCTATGGYIKPALVLYSFKKLLTAAELPIVRIHDLRHSTATLLKSLGVPIEVVREILGHSTISITAEIYGHEVPEMHIDAMQKLNHLLAENG